MKKQPLLNQPLSQVVAGMGHGDGLVIADAGLPIPPGPQRIDLALTPGVPGFLETVRVVLTELQVEEALAAEEMWQRSPAQAAALAELLAAAGIALRRVSHAELKQMSARAVAVVRTGETTPYCNVVLRSGVTF